MKQYSGFLVKNSKAQKLKSCCLSDSYSLGSRHGGSMIQIYGSPKSSSGRCFWALEEVGAKYERVPLNFQTKEHKSEKYLKLNPNGKVPTLVDGDFKIFESVAINNYLAEKHMPALLGSNLQERALVQQWTAWALSELQPPMVRMLIQVFFVPADKRDASVMEKGKEEAVPLFKILDQHLANHKYMVGDEFTLADINVASVVHIYAMIQLDISECKNILRWLDLLKERPAFKRVAALDH